MHRRLGTRETDRTGELSRTQGKQDSALHPTVFPRLQCHEHCILARSYEAANLALLELSVTRVPDVIGLAISGSDAGGPGTVLVASL